MFSAKYRRPVKKLKKMSGTGYKKDQVSLAMPTKRALAFRF